ncbi:uncharacterized protein BDZ99DRAFT_464365 [Mytilinidion resinicola]|uniref:Uncharacterized protein n=1 Tax=Mytilinidion resinicola TaxID=574789 RepID=A0A6A6YKK4_9PEZI|nr:uncharacterized protein BDZ99DRAFT_464365 [Mytilinidion resinicola]KAF2808495.1 hypothetical protein BDZ99DRAFT_464365 [Mytilinidion resinicola]
MDVYYFYTFSTAGWMALQAAPLIISPTIIVTMLSPEVREPSILEVYFSRSLGFSLITIGILAVLLTGSVPLSSRLTEAGGTTTDPSDPKAPYAVPTLMVTLIFHATIAFYTYALWTQTGVTSFALGTTFSAFLAVVGGWVILFGSSSGRISRKTGADKRTSGFPFKNAEASKRHVKKAL